MPRRKLSADEVVRTLRVRLKDKHAGALREMARAVNLTWNYCNDLSGQILRCERRFASSEELQRHLNGASKEGLCVGSAVFQQVAEEYVTRRRQFKRAKLRWRVSSGPRRSLGWIPFKARSLSYSGGQVRFQGLALSLWDSWGLHQFELGSGSISEDARGRWYLNVCVTVKKAASPKPALHHQAPDFSDFAGTGALGIDLGLKDFMTDSGGNKVEAQRFYRDLEQALGCAQRAGKKGRVRALHAKISNRRKDFLHKLSGQQVRDNVVIIVGDVNAAALARTKMAKSVLDAGWSAYRTMLQYKCDGAGRWFRQVDEAFSTQDCHACAARTGPKGLSGLGTRKWTCSSCGVEHERDHNSALNIRARGLRLLFEETQAHAPGSGSTVGGFEARAPADTVE